MLCAELDIEDEEEELANLEIDENKFVNYSLLHGEETVQSSLNADLPNDNPLEPNDLSLESLQKNKKGH